MAKTGKPEPATVSRSQLGWLLSASAATAAPLLLHLPIWLSALAVALYGWRAALWWQRRAIPPRWMLLLCVVLAVAGVLVAYRTLFGREAGVALLLLLLALKLMELRSARDALSGIWLCYFLQIALFFEDQSPAIAAYVMVDLVLITASLIALTRDGRPLRSLLRQSAVMVVQAIPFMIVMFVLFPRVDGPLWGMPRDAFSGLTGLSDTMSPGTISQLSLSGALAFRVEFDGPPPPQRELYWRGPVLTRFDGRSWSAARVTLGAALPYDTRGAAVRYAVTLEPHDKTWLYALDLPSSLPADAVITRDFQTLAKQPVRNRIRYALSSVPTIVAGREEQADVLLLARQLPGGWNPRARQLAASWRAESADAAALIARALRHFNQEPFVYTLSPPLLGEHNVDDFLFSTRRGFCEHFAASFVFLMRAAGLPARVVTGYQGGELNPVDGNLIVRQSDAHAWAEVWLAGKGWLRVDPTAAVAPSRIERGVAAALPEGDPLPFMTRVNVNWLKALRFRWEALSAAWDQWVLAYNGERQRDLLTRMGFSEPDWQALTGIMTLVTGAMILALALWTLRPRYHADPVERAWQSLNRKLARSGLERLAYEGPLDFSQRIAAERPRLGPEIEAIAQLYASLRYGARRSRTAITDLRRRVARFSTR